MYRDSLLHGCRVTLVQFCELLSNGKAIKTDIRVHCVCSFGTQTGICTTTEPEISWILGEKTEKQHINLTLPVQGLNILLLHHKL